MDTKFKYSIIFSTLLISISLACYLIYFLPKQKQLSNQIKCNEVGRKIYEEDVARNTNFNWFEPKFSFSSEINTCLYKGGYSYFPGYSIDEVLYSSRSDFIKDVYSNTYLAEWGFDGNNSSGDRKKYDKLNNAYFKKIYLMNSI